MWWMPSSCTAQPLPDRGRLVTLRARAPHELLEDLGAAIAVRDAERLLTPARGAEHTVAPGAFPPQPRGALARPDASGRALESLKLLGELAEAPLPQAEGEMWRASVRGEGHHGVSYRGRETQGTPIASLAQEGG